MPRPRARTGAWGNVIEGIAAKVMVCASLVTSKLRVTGGAVLNAPSPAWSASTVQVPAPTMLIVAPLAPPDVHTVGVVVVNVTASNDDAVAATVIGPWLTATPESAPNAIV